MKSDSSDSFERPKIGCGPELTESKDSIRDNENGAERCTKVLLPKIQSP